jgi:hypothetical protein
VGADSSFRRKMTFMQGTSNHIRNQLLLLFAVATVQYVFALWFYQPIDGVDEPFITPDSEGYTKTSEYLFAQGTPTPLVKYRLFAPIVPALAGVLSLQLGMVPSYLAINYVFMLIASAMVFLVYRRISALSDYALAAAVIFATSTPVILWGPRVLVEMASWAAVAILFFYALNPIGRNALLDTVMRIILYSLAVMIKPTMVFAVAFAGAYHFFVDRQYARAILTCAVGAILTLSVLASLGLAPGDFTHFGQPRHRHVLLVITSLVFAFHITLAFAAIGLAKFRHMTIRPTKLMLASVLCSGFMLAEFLLFVHAARLAFVMYPIVLTSSVCAIAYLIRYFSSRRRGIVYLVVLCVLCSNLTAHLYRSESLLRIGKQLVGSFWR